MCVCVFLTFVTHPECNFKWGLGGGGGVIRVTGTLHQSVLAETLMNMQPPTQMLLIFEKLKISRMRHPPPQPPPQPTPPLTPPPPPSTLELHFHSCKDKLSAAKQKVHRSACPSKRLIMCCAHNKVRTGILILGPLPAWLLVGHNKLSILCSCSKGGSEL